MAKKCSSIQKSLAWCTGSPELAGILPRIYYINKNDIVKYPQIPRDENGRPTSSVLNGDFVLAADATFKFIDILPDKSQLTSEAQGELPSQTQLNKLVAVHPGVGEEATELAASVNNADNLFVVRDMKMKFRVLGNEKWITKSTVAQDNGQGAAGTTSTTLNVEVSDELPAPFYVGKLVTEDGEIDCSGNDAAQP